MLCFVDTNIIVYALEKPDPDDPAQTIKREIAIDRLTLARQIVISTQVIGEFFNTVIRKGKPPLTMDEAAASVAFLSVFPVVGTDLDLVQAAVTRCKLSRIAYYDSLMIEAALRAGASILYSEDMHSGTRYGSLELRNPFPQSLKKKSKP